MKGKKKPTSVKGKVQFSKTMKREVGGNGVLLRRGEWERNRAAHLDDIAEKHTSTKHKCGTRKGIKEDVRHAMIVRASEGASIRDIVKEFHISKREVEYALKHTFADGETGAQKLKNLLLSNATQLAVQTRRKADDMNGMQSAVATGIMTSKFIELDKHLASKPRTVDLEALTEIAGELREMGQIIDDAGLSDIPTETAISDDDED